MAQKICNETESDRWHKSNAIDYLIKFKGKEYVINTFLPTKDIEFFRTITDKLMSFKNCKLENYLIERNMKSEAQALIIVFFCSGCVVNVVIVYI